MVDKRLISYKYIRAISCKSCRMVHKEMQCHLLQGCCILCDPPCCTPDCLMQKNEAQLATQWLQRMLDLDTAPDEVWLMHKDSPFCLIGSSPKILQSSDILTHLPFVASWIACWKLFKFESLNFDLCVWQCNLTWLFIEYLLSKSPPRGQVSFNAVLRSNLAAGDMKEAQPCFFIQCYCEDFS